MRWPWSTRLWQLCPMTPPCSKIQRTTGAPWTEHDTRRLIDETVQKCRALLDSSPHEALEIVREKLRTYPGNERLQVLHASIEQHLQHHATEEARTRYLTLANEALNKRQYREAVRVLETCQAEGTFSDEMKGLLDFARHEANREHRESAVEVNLGQAQALISKGAYEDAIKLLQPVVDRTGDLALTNLLEKARSLQLSLQHKLDAISNALASFLREEQFDEGVAFLKSQPEFVLRHPAAQEALKALRAVRDRSRRELQAIGMAYAALDNREVPAESDTLQTCCRAHPDSEFLHRFVQTLRRQTQGSGESSSRRGHRAGTECLGRWRFQFRAASSGWGGAFGGKLEVSRCNRDGKAMAKEVARFNIPSRIGLKGPRAV